VPRARHAFPCHPNSNLLVLGTYVLSPPRSFLVGVSKHCLFFCPPFLVQNPSCWRPVSLCSCRVNARTPFLPSWLALPPSFPPLGPDGFFRLPDLRLVDILTRTIGAHYSPLPPLGSAQFRFLSAEAYLTVFSPLVSSESTPLRAVPGEFLSPPVPSFVWGKDDGVPFGFSGPLFSLAVSVEGFLGCFFLSL